MFTLWLNSMGPFTSMGGEKAQAQLQDLTQCQFSGHAHFNDIRSGDNGVSKK